MTLHEVRRLFDHWKQYPPLRDLVAAAIGFKPQLDQDAGAAAKYMTADDMRRLMAMTGGKIAGMGQR